MTKVTRLDAPFRAAADRATAFAAIGQLLFLIRDHAGSERALAEARADATALDNDVGWFVALSIGWVAHNRGDRCRVAGVLRELDRLVPTTTPSLRIRYHLLVGQHSMSAGDHHGASASADAAIEACRSIGDAARLPRAFVLAGTARQLRGQSEAARAAFVDGLLCSLTSGELQPMTWSLLGCALIRSKTDPRGAATLAGAADDMAARYQLTTGRDLPLSERSRERLNRDLEERLGEAELKRVRLAGARMELTDLVRLASSPL